jgi:type III restriction enzyme
MIKLLDTFNVLEENQMISEQIDSYVNSGLRYTPRPYQISAINRFEYFLKDFKKRPFPAHLFFHMATGSGKTLVMAANIIQLYENGYRNFVFVTHLTNIIKKTKDNFLNNSIKNSKYLFSSPLIIHGKEICLNEVDDFSQSDNSLINIHFTSAQALQSKIQNPTEYGLSEDDFENKNIAIIWDESHHGNVQTQRAQNELGNFDNWEATISYLLNLNPKNILLEFSATMDFENSAIEQKYRNKRIYDYSLKQFRLDGYSKEIKANQIKTEPIDRILISILISQFKKKVFAYHGKLIKPVVLAKSKKISDSKDSYIEFVSLMDSLNASKIDLLRNFQNELLNKAFKYFDSIDLTTEDLVAEIKNDFSEEKLISIDTENESEANQILVNTLEQENNPIRLIFAVDKLNEGWDVLNLFDIARLYDTRDARSNVPGKTTIQEAQLIGRGARYCPFEFDDKDKFKRKFDNDLEHPLRVCETLHYHCSYNPRYIDELTTALKQIGIIEEERKEFELTLKNTFKSSKLYKSGFLYLNKKISSSNTEEFQEPNNFNKVFEYQIFENIGLETSLFENEKTTASIQLKKKVIKLNQIKKYIKIKCLSSNSFFSFNNLKKYFPSIETVDDFLAKNYLGDSEIHIKASEKKIKDIDDIDIFNALKAYLLKISEEIVQNYGDFQGSKIFYRQPFNKVFKDKTLLAKDGSLTGDSELDVSNLDWYPYEENFGTSEEKYLVRYINDIADQIKAKYENFYLVRNERFFKIYRFSDGRAFEPDYVMFLKEENNPAITAIQLFIEPKGEPYLAMDDWKEKFLFSINEKNVEFEHKALNIKIIGLPFYNEYITKREFQEAFFKTLGL